MIDKIEAEIETFLKGNEKLASGHIEQLLKSFHDELYVDGMDDEQIYQQIDVGLTGVVLEEKVDLFERDDDSEEDVKKKKLTSQMQNEPSSKMKMMMKNWMMRNSRQKRCALTKKLN